MPLCPAPRDAGMVGSVLETVDCHIRVLVQDSYRNLVGPDTWFATAFTGMLTIYIALMGYQLLVGRGGLRVTELPFTGLKIGLILAFLTSWAAYQTLVFDLLFDGPSEILKALLKPMVDRGASFDGDVMGGVERSFKRMSTAAGVYGGMASPSANILQGGPMLGSGLLWLSAITLLLTTVGLIVAAKVVLAFLLAMGPVFIGMALFDATRGLFEGWLRATLAFAMTPLAVAVFGAAMLMILAPFLDILAEKASQNIFDMGPPITIALVVVVFAMVMSFALRAVAAIAAGFSLGRDRDDAPRLASRLPAPPAPAYAGGPSGRAEAVAARIAMFDRTSGDLLPPARETFTRRVGEAADAVGAHTVLPTETKLGQAYNRAPRPVTVGGEADRTTDRNQGGAT